MDPKLFTFLEYLFIGALLIAVLYAGGVFGEPVWPESEPAPAGNPVKIAPPSATAGPPTSAPAPAATETQPPTRIPAPQPDPISYQIAPGDTCSGIAARFGISLARLIAANNLDAQCLIRAGDTLTVPLPPTTLTP